MARYGDAPALVRVDGDQVTACSFSELAELSRRLGAGLHASGVAPRDPVGLLGPNSFAWITVYLGIVSAGAVAVPLDDSASTPELAAMLRTAGCRVLFTSAAHAERLMVEPAMRGLGIFLLDAAAVAEANDRASWQSLVAPSQADLPRSSPADTAMVVFTSGTTGAPKAVPLSHANLVANVEALLAERLAGAGDRMMLPLPLHHVYPLVVGCLAPLASGVSVVLPAGFGGPEIAGALRYGAATHLVGVPKLYATLLDALRSRLAARRRALARLFELLLAVCIWVRKRTGVRVGRLLFGRLHRALGPELRVAICGGAALDPDTEWALEGLGWEVLTGYGLTETSPILTFNRRGATRPGSAGRPVAGVALRIERPDRQGIGEIEAKGAGVFAGYHANTEATAAAFTADGWFRTGDLGRFDADGYLHVVGRLSETIVLAAGNKIDPENLEHVFEASPYVREIAVLATDGGFAALVVPDLEAIRARGTGRIEDLLRDELNLLGTRLPSWQRPSGFAVTRTPLPRTNLGKIRRHLLPRLYAAAREHRSSSGSWLPSPEDLALLGTATGARLWAWLQSRFPDRRLSLETSPQLDLGLDSLGWIGVSLDIRSALGLDLGEDAIARVVTLRDLLREAVRVSDSTVAARRAETVVDISRGPAGPLLLASQWVVAALNRAVMRLAFGLRAEGLRHLPEQGPYVLCPNHASYLDAFAVAAALPLRVLRSTYWGGWVGRLFRGRASRLFSRIVQAIPVDPDSAAASSLAFGLMVLRSNRTLVWLPEGVRSPTGELQAFRPGIGVLLRETGARAVPVRISGSFECWPRHRRLPRLGRITVRFGQPTEMSVLASLGQGSTDAERIADALRTLVSKLP